MLCLIQGPGDEKTVEATVESAEKASLPQEADRSRDVQIEEFAKVRNLLASRSCYPNSTLNILSSLFTLRSILEPNHDWVPLKQAQLGSIRRGRKVTLRSG